MKDTNDILTIVTNILQEPKTQNSVKMCEYEFYCVYIVTTRLVSCNINWRQTTEYTKNRDLFQ